MDTRTALLDSAERVARARGYEGFSYADLAKEVGIRKASIHYHFPKKADLAQALIARYRINFFENIEKISTDNQTGGARLKAYLNLYKTGLSNCDALCLCVAFSVGPESLSSPVLKELETFHGDSLIWLASVFELGVHDGSIMSSASPENEAAATMALVEGAQLLARSANKISYFDRSLEQLLSRIT